MSRPVVDQGPGYLRVAAASLLVGLFALPCLAGRYDTYFVLLCGLLLIVAPSIRASFSLRTRNPVDLLFVSVFIALAVAFALSADEPYDLLYALNFLPLLIAIPFRWQLERIPFRAGLRLVAWLSLAGVIIALGTALVQVFLFGRSRVGQPLMSPFQYADTAMLLGFLALAGAFDPAEKRKWPFVLGPLVGVAAVLLSGTRGALLALPALAVVAFAFALLGARRKGLVVAIAVACCLALVAIAGLGYLLGLDRAVEAFSAAGELLGGGTVDAPTRERLTMLSGGYQAFWQSPWYGYGWGDMVKAILPWVPAAEVERFTSFRQLHNGLASFAVGAGSIGIVAFAALSVAPLIAVLARPRDETRGVRLYLAVTMCVGFAVFQLTIIMLGFEFHTVQFAFMTMAFAALGASGKPPSTSDTA